MLLLPATNFSNVAPPLHHQHRHKTSADPDFHTRPTILAYSLSPALSSSPRLPSPSRNPSPLASAPLPIPSVPLRFASPPSPASRLHPPRVIPLPLAALCRPP